MFNRADVRWVSRWVSRWASLLLVLLGFCGPVQAGAGKGGGGRPPLQGLVNINSASLAQLQLLSGVGPAKAQRIAEYREKHPFRTVEELGRVKGIGPKTVRKERLWLTVRGPTTAGSGAAGSSAGAADATSNLAADKSSQVPPALRRPEPGAEKAAPLPDSLGAALPR